MFETQDNVTANIFKLQHLKHLSDYADIKCFSGPVLAIKHFHLKSEHVSRCVFIVFCFCLDLFNQ